MSNETRGIIYKEASGSIASFNTNVVGDCRSVVADINPVQDLHGQDSPYPAGGGKNKFNQSAIESRSTTTNSIVNNNGVLTVTIGEGSTYNGISTTQTLRSLAPYLVAGQTYTLTVNTTGVAQIYLLDVKWESGQSMAITDELLDKNVWLYANGKGTTATISGIQIEEGTTATAFAPYENICPITGHTQAVVTRTSVNVWDEEWEVGGINTSGIPYAVTTRIRSKNYINVPNGATLYFKSPVQLRVCQYDINKNFLQLNGLTNTAFTLRDDCYYLLFATNADSYGTTYNNDISINYPSTDTEYHASAGGQSITIPFGQTVYGGTVDVVSGKLTVDRAIVDLGTLQWQYNTTYSFFLSNSLTDRKVGILNLISDLFKTEAGSWSGTPKPNAIWGNGSNATIYVQTPPTDNVADFLTLVTGHQLVYKLATPITIDLTPQQLTTLLGDNNVWADTGDITVEYPYNDTSRNMDFLRLLFIESMWGGEEE